jgi:aryl-phospho-beta-D-glucosidase BglC (GH1 family)
VKLVDPDGRDFNLNEFGIHIFNDLLNNFLNYFNNVATDPQIRNEAISGAAKQIANDASNAADRVMNQIDRTAVYTFNFISDYGSYVSLVCYAAGQIELGLIVDGVTVASTAALISRQSSGKDMDAIVLGTNVGVGLIGQKLLLKNIRLSNNDIEKIVAFGIEVAGISAKAVANQD